MHCGGKSRIRNPQMLPIAAGCLLWGGGWLAIHHTIKEQLRSPIAWHLVQSCWEVMVCPATFAWSWFCSEPPPHSLLPRPAQLLISSPSKLIPPLRQELGSKHVLQPINSHWPSVTRAREEKQHAEQCEGKINNVVTCLLSYFQKVLEDVIPLWIIKSQWIILRPA